MKIKCPECGCLFSPKDVRKKSIIDSLEKESLRFNELKRATDTSALWLTELLQELMEDGIVERRQLGKQNVRYSLKKAPRSEEKEC